MRKISYKLTGKFLKGDPEKIVSPNDIVRQKAALVRVFKGLVDSAVEQFWALFLDAQNKPIAVDVCAVGTADACAVHPRDILKGALMANASAIIIVHNHPSGNCKFSREDIAMTGRAVNAAYIVGLRVIDHIVICKDGFTSMRGEGWHDFRPSSAAKAAAEPRQEPVADQPLFYAHVGWPKDEYFDKCKGPRAKCEAWLTEKLDELKSTGVDTSLIKAELIPADKAERIVIEGRHVFRPSETKAVEEHDVEYETQTEHVEYPE